jgi:hypothetical protein
MNRKASEVWVNWWALKHYKPITEETILAALNEVEVHIANTKGKKVFASISDAYALAARFKGVLYRPFIKQKPLRILRAVIDRCGEAYYEKNTEKLYIGKDVVDSWSRVFQIPQERINEYLAPLLRLNVLEPSDRPNYVYRVSMRFFQLVGPVAQYLVQPVEPRRLREMMEVASGLTSIYVVAHAVRNLKYSEEGPRIPWFLRLSIIYTQSGLEAKTMRIRDVLELGRINVVDNYFIKEKQAPVEWWRSIRAEAFEFMTDNKVIEDYTSVGYKLNTHWTRICEEGVKRYSMRLIARHRGF